MPWPSKNPDDYVGRKPVFQQGTPIGEPAAQDWRRGAVDDERGRLLWMIALFGAGYVASLIAGADLFGTGLWTPLMILPIVYSSFFARRSEAARLVAPAWPPSRRFAPVGGIPVAYSAASSAAFLFVGAAFVGVLSSNEDSQSLATIGLLFALPVPAWLLERALT